VPVIGGMTAGGEDGKALAPPERAQTGLYVRASKGLKLRDRKTERLARRSAPYCRGLSRPIIRLCVRGASSNI